MPDEPLDNEIGTDGSEAAEEKQQPDQTNHEVDAGQILQTNSTGKIFSGPNPNHPSVVQVENVLKAALSSHGWTGKLERDPARKVKFHAIISKASEEYELEIYVFRNLAYSHPRGFNEKRIQITEDLQRHRQDFELPHSGKHRCLLMGMYIPSEEEAVLCLWNAMAYVNHGVNASVYTKVQAIRDAYVFGLGVTEDNKKRSTYALRPEFLHYYIRNMEKLHSDHKTLLPFLAGDVSDDEQDQSIETDQNFDADRMTGGRNIIRYGAPGTGKSFSIDNETSGQLSFRTVFHQSLEHSDFFGTLKPSLKDGRITYGFAPGPFALALVAAITRPTERVNLIIEEINRGPAAAIFADLFLLLDRNQDGSGTYDIATPTPEFASWFIEQTGVQTAKIKLPSNLWLLATMNSSDQGVFPLDTAFRRRWDQIYERLDFTKAPSTSFSINLGVMGEKQVSWVDFAEAVNQILRDDYDVAEDRLLGPWFVKGDDELSNVGIPHKILLYLWDDVLRHGGRQYIFNTDTIKSYGDLVAASDAKKPILSNLLISKLS